MMPIIAMRSCQSCLDIWNDTDLGLAVARDPKKRPAIGNGAKSHGIYREHKKVSHKSVMWIALFLCILVAANCDEDSPLNNTFDQRLGAF